MPKLSVILLLQLTLLARMQVYAQHTDSQYQAIISSGETINTVDKLIAATDSLTFMYESEPMSYALKALSLSRKLGYKKGVGMSYRCIGTIYRIYRGNVIRAKSYYDSAIDLLKDINSPGEYGRTLRGLASVAQIREGFNSNNVRTLYYDAIKVLEAGNKFDKAIAREQRAFLIMGDGQTEEGQKIIDSLILFYEHENQLLRNLFLLDASTPYFITRDTIKAKYLNGRVFELSRKYKLKAYTCLAYIRAGEILMSRHAYKDALKAFHKADEITNIVVFKKYPLYQGIAICYEKIGNRHFAGAYLQKGLALTKEYNIKEAKAEFYTLLSSFYERGNQFDSALFFQKKYGEVTDSVAKDNIRHTSEMESFYQAKQRIAENEKLKRDVMMQRIFSVSGGLVTLILASLVIIILRSRKEIKDKNQILTETNEDLNSKNNEILAQNEEIQAQQEQLSTAYENAKTLNDIGKAITSCLSVEEIAETASKQISSLMEFSIFGIAVLNDNENKLDFPQSIRKGEPLPPFSKALDDPSNLWVWCILNKKSILADNLHYDYHDPYIPERVRKSDHTLSFICVPLMQKGMATGLIYLQADHPNAYTNYHLNLLQNIALYAQVALENSRNHKLIIEKNEILGRHNSVKDKLFSVVAHDIRGPMNSLRGLLQLISSRGITEDERNQLLSRIDENFKYTQQLIDNVLHWANAQIRGIEVIKGKFDLQYTCNQTINLLQEVIRKKEIQVESKVPPILAFGDENMIQLVLRNLLSNSIKFVARGGKIEITSEEKDDLIKVCVADNGVGISPEHQKQLFQMETRHTSYGTEKEKGTGLGLSLCREFIEKNDGKIWVESELGKGSKFFFTIQKRHQAGNPILAKH